MESVCLKCNLRFGDKNHCIKNCPELNDFQEELVDKIIYHSGIDYNDYYSIGLRGNRVGSQE